MKLIDSPHRKRIFGLLRDAYRASGSPGTMDEFRKGLQAEVGIESLSNCSAEKGLKLMNRLHRILGDVPPGSPNDGQTGVSAPQNRRSQEGKPAPQRLRGPAGGRPKGILEWSGEQKAQLQKVEALLADMQLSWDYADAIAKRMFGGSVLRVDTLDGRQLRGVITALVKRQQKKGGRRYGRGRV